MTLTATEPKRGDRFHHPDGGTVRILGPKGLNLGGHKVVFVLHGANPVEWWTVAKLLETCTPFSVAETVLPGEFDANGQSTPAQAEVEHAEMVVRHGMEHDRDLLTPSQLSLAILVLDLRRRFGNAQL